ncbi:uncharacterized protein METZ01_LOCUS142454 [marine metagenome]|uniref:Baseplate tail tube cap n=1 Tax=marine metagenome TaxID=408172 RepID=A0A381ZK28_9ZZZZ
MADKNYNYPVGIGAEGGINGQPYMLLTSYESKNSIESETPIISSIALYIPPNGLRTAFDANYDGLEGGAMRATMGGAMSRLNMSALYSPTAGNNWAEGNIGESLFAGFKSAGTAALGKLSSAVDKGTGMLAAQGIAVNNHMSLVYKGPGQFRTHDFAFNFFPKAEQDSLVIKDILKDLKDGMLPRMSGTPLKKNRAVSAPFFMAPRHWTIDFFKGDGTENTYLHKIKKSVIKNMQINHDPNSTISLHEDGSPVQTTLSLSFQEIELPFSGDEGGRRAEEIAEQIETAQAAARNPHTR